MKLLRISRQRRIRLSKNFERLVSGRKTDTDRGPQTATGDTCQGLAAIASDGQTTVDARQRQLCNSYTVTVDMQTEGVSKFPDSEKASTHCNQNGNQDRSQDEVFRMACTMQSGRA